MLGILLVSLELQDFQRIANLHDVLALEARLAEIRLQRC